MDDLTTLAQIVAVLTLTIAPVILINRFLAGHDPDPIDGMTVPPQMPWPHGVQEEDPRPWRFAPPSPHAA
jgi:hypothetical protein